MEKVITHVIRFVVITVIFTITWNSVIPNIFGLTKISYWQSFKLLILIECIFYSCASLLVDTINITVNTNENKDDDC